MTATASPPSAPLPPPLPLLLLLSLWAPPRGAAAAAGPGPVDLFVTGVSGQPWSKGQHVCYRIPALQRTLNGTLLAIVSERISASGCDDESGANIVQRRSTDGGKTWGPMTLVLAAASPGPLPAERSAWTLQDAATGEVFVFSNTYVVGDCTCKVM